MLNESSNIIRTTSFNKLNENNLKTDSNSLNSYVNSQYKSDKTSSTNENSSSSENDDDDVISSNDPPLFHHDDIISKLNKINKFNNKIIEIN